MNNGTDTYDITVSDRASSVLSFTDKELLGAEILLSCDEYSSSNLDCGFSHESTSVENVLKVGR
jgi:hypothetical protein